MKAPDALVVGGGPAGCAAALALLGAGRSVALLVGGRPAPHVGEALPPAANPLLRDLGIWDAFLAERFVRSPGNRSAWGADILAEHDFVRDPSGPGWHVDRARFDALLRQQVRAKGGPVVSTHVTGAEPVADGVRLRSRDGDSFWGPLVVDATGRASAVAGRLGARRRSDDALIAHVTPYVAAIGDVDARTVIEATPDGWWYSTLAGTGHRTVALVTDADLSATPVADTVHLKALIASAFPAGPSRRAPANGAVLEPLVGKEWVAAGDAALSFDPLSSQGILTALFTGLMAGRAVAATLGGDSGAFGEYAARLRAIRGGYVNNRSDYYAIERRWPERRFWRRRQARSLTGAHAEQIPDRSAMSVPG